MMASRAIALPAPGAPWWRQNARNPSKLRVPPPSPKNLLRAGAGLALLSLYGSNRDVWVNASPPLQGYTQDLICIPGGGKAFKITGACGTIPIVKPGPVAAKGRPLTVGSWIYVAPRNSAQDDWAFAERWKRPLVDPGGLPVIGTVPFPLPARAPGVVVPDKPTDWLDVPRVLPWRFLPYRSVRDIFEYPVRGYAPPAAGPGAPAIPTPGNPPPYYPPPGGLFPLPGFSQLPAWVMAWEKAPGRRATFSPVRAGLHDLRRPARREKEMKVRFRYSRLASFTMRVLNAATEFNDLVNALYSALPGYRKIKRTWGTRWNYGPHTKQWPTVDGRGPRRTVNGRVEYIQPLAAHEKAARVWKYFNEIDRERAVTNIIENQVEDFVFGRIGNKLRKANRKRRTRYGAGPAL